LGGQRTPREKKRRPVKQMSRHHSVVLKERAIQAKGRALLSELSGDPNDIANRFRCVRCGAVFCGVFFYTAFFLACVLAVTRGFGGYEPHVLADGDF
jgi:hypothetical protein